MNILLYDMGSYTYKNVKDTLEQLGHSTDTIYYHFNNRFDDSFFCERLIEKIHISKYDCVFSVNFFPLVAAICNESGLPYISWSYDSPLSEQLVPFFIYPTNYIFLFDKMEVIKYQQMGYDRVFHMPLAVNTDRIASSLSSIPHGTYNCDISFVGTLYYSSFDALLYPLNNYCKGYIDALLQIQLGLYGCNILDSSISNEIMEQINSSYKAIGSDQIKLNKTGLSYSIAKQITHIERSFLLNELAEYFNVHFFTTDQCNLANKVKVHGPVKYNNEMYAVFRDSKLNLCPTLRSIVSGIPLRALDIIGSGGVLFSNYQPELAEIFIDGEDVIMYESIEDAFSKASFYLNNQESLDGISRKGLSKVKKHFSYEKSIIEMLSYMNKQ